MVPQADPQSACYLLSVLLVLPDASTPRPLDGSNPRGERLGHKGAMTIMCQGVPGGEWKMTRGRGAKGESGRIRASLSL